MARPEGFEPPTTGFEADPVDSRKAATTGRLHGTAPEIDPCTNRPVSAGSSRSRTVSSPQIAPKSEPRPIATLRKLRPPGASGIG